jgi:hypothetical protein
VIQSIHGEHSRAEDSMAQKVTFKKRPFKYVKDKHPSHFIEVKFIHYVYKDGVMDKFYFLLEKKHSYDSKTFYHLYANGDYVSHVNSPGAAYNTEEIDLAKMAMVQQVNGLPVTVPWKTFSERMAEQYALEAENRDAYGDGERDYYDE